MNNVDSSNSSIKVEIITPDNSFKYLDVHMAVMPGSDGEFGVLQGHMPLIASLDDGVITIYDKDMKIIDRISISAGFVEVTSTAVLILVEQASLMN